MKISTLKFLTIFCYICFISSCAIRSGPIITMNSYLQIQNGETREQILKTFGPPFTIELKDDGTEIFGYIERFSTDEKITQARYYYFYIKDDKVIGKVVTIEDRPQTIDSDEL